MSSDQKYDNFTMDLPERSHKRTASSSPELDHPAAESSDKPEKLTISHNPSDSQQPPPGPTGSLPVPRGFEKRHVDWPMSSYDLANKQYYHEIRECLFKEDYEDDHFIYEKGTRGRVRRKERDYIEGPWLLGETEVEFPHKDVWVPESCVQTFYVVLDKEGNVLKLHKQHVGQVEEMSLEATGVDRLTLMRRFHGDKS